MNRGRGLAGSGGIVFAIIFMVAFTLFGPKGGHYSVVEVYRFVAQGSGSLAASVVVFAIAVAGLIALMAHLSEWCSGTGWPGRVTWATGLLAAASMLVGWALYLAPAGSVGSGGPELDAGISYAFLNAGMQVLFGIGGLALGIGMFTLAARGQAMPMWLRTLTGLAGLSALATWPFLMAVEWSPNQWLPGPFYLVILWALVTGIWLIVASPVVAAVARDEA